MLKIQNLYYKDILKDISFTLKDNLIILGENGAGKSTLAKMLCGLIPNNFVYFDNQPLKAIKNRATRINYIPATLTLYDENITVTEYLQSAFYTSYIDFHAIKKIMNQFALKEQFLSTLSSGQKQLLQIALALLQDAKTTIFDEPTANLDPQNSKKVFDILQHNFQQKIVITHDLNLAYNLGYQILYLDNGEVRFTGTFEDFIKRDFYDGYVKITPYGVVTTL